MHHGTHFLHQNNSQLHTSHVVERANKQAEEPSQLPAEKIANFLQRYHAALHPTGNTNEDIARKADNNRRYLVEKLLPSLIIAPTDIPESAFILEQQIAANLGHGEIEITEEFKQRKAAQIIADQKASLHEWVTYLASPDAQYPDYAKYWAFTGMQSMGKLVKEQDANGAITGNVYFQQRTKQTVAPYPTCNPRALAAAISALDAYLQAEAARKKLPKAERKRSPLIIANTSTKLSDQEFTQLIATKNFSKIYTQFLVELPEYSEAGLREIRGTWVTYKQDSDATPLVESLKGHPLEWCTANPDTAKTQLQSGDFHVYYSLDQDQKPTIPRLAIRMEGESIAELRGIAPKQEVDPYITPVIDEKLKEFGDEGKQYQKKSHDMRKITELTKKQAQSQVFTKEELTFLYEINYTIEGFGYEKDPRIAELRSKRDKQEDTLIILECTKEQLATTKEQINETAKAYIGPLTSGIFTTLQEYNIQHIYTQFPERPVTLGMVELGKYTAEQLLVQLKEQGYRINNYVKQMLQNKTQFIDPVNTEYKALQGKTKTLHTVTLEVQDLGFTSNPTIEQLFAKAKELGLELCPPATGPFLCLQDTDQPMNTYYGIAMEPITAADGNPYVFGSRRVSNGRWLPGLWMLSSNEWDLDNRFVFCLSKSR